jgi:uncharacterized protein (DUF362 family)/Pyruvate/2-oxoacid:ferredoxin oxidoreductase delta subunit
MSKVAIISCYSYDPAEVRRAVRRGFDLLGGTSAFMRPGDNILLKPNWLSADPPEKAVTTHPSVFQAVAEILLEAGASLTYGDSPAFQSPRYAAKRTGIAAVAESLRIPLADFRDGREVHFREGLQNKKFDIVNAVFEAESIVSLPKMKTHGFLRITGAVKNQFGCIPGALKSEFHVKVPDAYEFAKMLVDLNVYLRPILYTMDGIVAMEGNGPRGGSPKKMNVLLFSDDPVALDATMCRLMDLDPALVATNRAGLEAGLGTYLEQDIQILGDPIESLIARDFVVNRNPDRPFQQRNRSGFIKNTITPKPFILKERCVRCGICVNLCPVSPKAVDWHDGDKSIPPSYRYDRCIRCYCCQEICPESAVQIKVPLLRKIISRM